MASLHHMRETRTERIIFYGCLGCPDLCPSGVAIPWRKGPKMSLGGAVREHIAEGRAENQRLNLC